MDIIISNNSQEPIYEQILKQIKDLIIQGRLKESEQLPSIRALAKNLNISVITTKRAYDELEREGYLVSIPGKGSFVAAQNTDLLYEARLKIVEEKLIDAIETGKAIDLDIEQLIKMIKILYKEA